MLGISLVTYHTPDSELQAILSTLKDVENATVHVIDNGSEDRIRSICRQYGVDYTPQPNVGYGAAHNVAMRASLENPAIRYHLVLNTDLQFKPQDIANMVGYMDAKPDIALLHPRIVGTDGADQFTARLIPTPADLLLRRFLPGAIAPQRRRRYLMQDHDHSVPFEAGYVQGSFMLMRCDALRQVGLFDERFFMYPEDIDLSRRLHQAGKVVYYPYATVVHAHRAASYRNPRMLLIHLANMARYFTKWGWLIDPVRAALNREITAQNSH